MRAGADGKFVEEILDKKNNGTEISALARYATAWKAFTKEILGEQYSSGMPGTSSTIGVPPCCNEFERSALNESAFVFNNNKNMCTHLPCICGWDKIKQRKHITKENMNNKTKGIPFEEQKEYTPMRVDDVTRGYPRRTRKTHSEKQRGTPLTEHKKLLGIPNKSSNVNKKDMGGNTPINMLKDQQMNTIGKQTRTQHNTKGIPFDKGDITQINALVGGVCSLTINLCLYYAWGIPKSARKGTTMGVTTATGT